MCDSDQDIAKILEELEPLVERYRQILAGNSVYGPYSKYEYQLNIFANMFEQLREKYKGRYALFVRPTENERALFYIFNSYGSAYEYAQDCGMEDHLIMHIWSKEDDDALGDISVGFH